MVLVLDLGSSATRALLYDREARLQEQAVARRAFQFHTDPDGRSEDNPQAALARIEAVIDDVLGKTPLSELNIVAIGISAYACSLLCLDEHGRPLTPVFTYADTRAADDARMLRREEDEMATLQRTGCRIRANYWPARLLWLQRTQPSIFNRTRWFVSLADYLGLRLFGRLRAGISTASWTGMINRHTGDWDDKWLDRLGLAREQLPPIASDNAALCGPIGPYAERWPALREALCFPPLGDGAAANIGSGCIDASRIALTIGSTAALRITLQKGESYIPPALWFYHLDHVHGLMGGATTEGGNVFGWLRDTFKLPSAESLEAALAGAVPDGHGLTVLPMFGGERSPGFADDARATLHGLSFDTTPADIAQACMEAISYRLGHIYDALREVVHRDDTGAQANPTLIASGGALLGSPSWRQMIADVTGAAVQICVEPEATGRGAALMALYQAGFLPHLGAVPTQLGPIHEPNPARQERYLQAKERQAELYRLLVEHPSLCCMHI
ncbi:MAG: gluconokinase [Anaerolineae bacterium]|nr:gluconokinase [Thermoflexales bacterium]MDW8407513.1 gluconokinase [Anaerolineae bacterium]